MRKVRTSGLGSNNPALMFARGVEQIVSDHMAHQPRYDDQELVTRQASPGKKQNKGNVFSLLMQHLFWQKCR